MTVRVLMVRLPASWTLAQIEAKRTGIPAVVAPFAPAEADGLRRDLDALQGGYCELSEAQWELYRRQYVLRGGRR